MVLAVQTKKRPSQAAKKRTGHHQKHTRHYLKTYWPYLPLLFLAAGANTVIDQHTSWQTSASLADTTRLQVWTHTSYGMTLAVALAAIVCASIVYTRHAKAWHKVLVKGEVFALEHRLLDFILVSLAITGVIVTKAV